MVDSTRALSTLQLRIDHSCLNSAAPVIPPVTSPMSDSQAVLVRQFIPADHDAVVALFVDGMNSHPAHQNEYTAEYIASCLRADLADIDGSYMARSGNFWVATLPPSTLSETPAGGEAKPQDVIVGMIGIECIPGSDASAKKAGEVRRLAVRSDCKRLGIGRILMAHLEQWASANGYATIHLSTGVVMRDAIAFYSKIGYKFVGEKPESPEYMLACFKKELL